MNSTSSAPWRALAAACALAAVLVGLALLAFAFAPKHSAWLARSLDHFHRDGDFLAYYCAGKIAASGVDPYRTEPLRTCEHSLGKETWNQTALDVTPAPMPAYALAMFGLLAHLPYDAAKALWYLVLLASLVVATVCLSRVTGLPWYVVLAALAIPFAYKNLELAQVPPVAVALLCAAAYLVRERRFALAGCAAGLSMIEPHIGLPACIATFAFLPACRIALTAMAGAAAFASVAMLGVATNVEFFTRVLPLHAYAEIGSVDQWSLTWFLHFLGIKDSVALASGSIFYALMTIVGLALGWLCARAYDSEHFIVLAPPAVAMLGGAFVHDTQYAAVMPAALAIAAAAGTALVWTAVAILAWPWSFGGTLYPLVAIVALAIIARHLVGRALLPPHVWTAAGIVFAILTVAIDHAPRAPVRGDGSPTAFYDSLGADQQFASASWGVQERRGRGGASLHTLAEKVPWWSGIVLMLAAAGVALARRPSAALSSSSRMASTRTRLASG